MRRFVLALSCCWGLIAAADDAIVVALTSKMKLADMKRSITKGFLVSNPGTLLVVQKDGLTVGWGGTYRRTTKLRDGQVASGGGGRNAGRPLQAGEGLFIYKIESRPTALILGVVTADTYGLNKPGHGEQLLEFEYDKPLAEVGTSKVVSDLSQWLKTEAESSVARTVASPPPPPALSARASTPPAEPEDPGLTNEGVVALVEAELGDEIVIAKLKNAHKVTFDLSTETLKALKKARVSSPVIAAMIERAATSAANASSRSSDAGSSKAASTQPSDPCESVELMGLFKEDMRPMSPLIIYQAKLRNASSMTKVVRLEWLDMYAQAMQSTTQVGAGQIVTLQLAAQEPFQRQPINLRLASCR